MRYCHDCNFKSYIGSLGVQEEKKNDVTELKYLMNIHKVTEMEKAMNLEMRRKVSIRKT